MPGGVIYALDPDVPVPQALRIRPDALAIWVIYARPADYPEHFVLRPQLALPRGETAPVTAAWVAKEPEPLRELVKAMGLTYLGRSDKDAAQILEVWV